MSKTATTPPKPTTTPAKAKRQGVQPTAAQTPAKGAASRKPVRTARHAATPETKLGSKVGRSLQNKPSSAPARSQVGSQSVPSGTKLGSKSKTKPTKEPTSVKPAKKPAAKPLPKLDPAGFQRASTATLTLTATVQHAQESAGSHAAVTPGSASQGDAAGEGKPAREPSELERRFAFEYVQDGNAMRAYMRATRTTNEGTAATMGWRLLNRVEVRGLVDAERLELQKRIGFTNEDLLRRIVMMVTADARELVEHIVESCRYCHGFEHEYQRTQIEYERDRREFESFGRQRIGGQYVNPRSAKGKARKIRVGEDEEVFEVQGGTGFDPATPPHPGCPQCHGHGQPKTIFKDTRLLSPGAAMLYAGAEETKDGFKFKMHDQVALTEKLAKHLGLYDADNRQRATNPLTDLIAAISGPRAALGITKEPAE